MSAFTRSAHTAYLRNSVSNTNFEVKPQQDSEPKIYGSEPKSKVPHFYSNPENQAILQRLKALDSEIKNLIHKIKFYLTRNPKLLFPYWESFFYKLGEQQTLLRRVVLPPSDKAYFNENHEMRVGEAQDIYDDPYNQYFLLNGTESVQKWSPEKFANPKSEVNILRKRMRIIIEKLRIFHNDLSKSKSKMPSDKMKFYSGWQALHTRVQELHRDMEKADSVTPAMRATFHFAILGRMEYMFDVYRPLVVQHRQTEWIWSPELIITEGPTSRTLEPKRYI